MAAVSAISDIGPIWLVGMVMSLAGEIVLLFQIVLFCN